jgi:hypothetical protein
MDDGKPRMTAPTPVALVVENLPRIEKAYLAHRSHEEPAAALELALFDVLEDEVDPVVEFIYGSVPESPEPGKSWADGTNEEHHATKGQEFGEFLIGQFEGDLAEATALPAKAGLWRRLNLVDLAEALATDQEMAAIFSRAPRTASAVADRVVDLVLTKAAKAWTKTGRHAKVAQSLVMFEALGAKAASAADSDPVARDQAAWCAAIAERLLPHSR